MLIKQRCIPIIGYLGFLATPCNRLPIVAVHPYGAEFTVESFLLHTGGNYKGKHLTMAVTMESYVV